MAQPYVMKVIEFELDGANYECLVESYELTSTTETQEAAALCPTGTYSVPGTTKFALSVTAFHDHTPDRTSLGWFLIDHAGEKASFSITDNGIKIAGTASIIAPSLGGSVNEFSKFTVELPLSGKPSFTADGASYPADKTAVVPGMEFNGAMYSTVTVSDAPNAAKLAGLGFISKSSTKWSTGDSFKVNTFPFHWGGTAWAHGASA